ncbi:MAG: sulfide/dihydroorotate dehydrogenase-like FAD/NAD-binding protein [Lachnospiraceae bacterium]|nr:sulfide/dihydroorotate dehydrogenase-like FAD/NAD-binding protein [Lachnospiraceae bacterium]
MFRIVKAKMLVEKIYLLEVEAPRIAHTCEPGQFVIVRADETSERIPLTICDYDREAGTVTLVIQVIGASSYKIAQLKTGEMMADITGPLGLPSDFVNEDIEEVRKRNYLFVCGGLGTAPVLPQIKWMKEHGVSFDVIVGTKTHDTLILEKEFEEVAGEHYFITTDDGSYKRSGMVTVCMEDLIGGEGRHYDVCVAIGPMIMMKFASQTSLKYGIHTIVSMNPIMVDGTGMCGACRLLIDGEVKFACVDGPEFDAAKVDFDSAMKRMALYKTEEGRAYLKAQEGDTHHGGCGHCNGD